ncbi:MAG: phosphoribosylformylglycinamidine synthase subunit PurQ [Candidatus Schekmanbacteria bacterium]|nr:MAG: phosphoribosylformylglycinamidine synthase subunit PurQ [Candidatus Schekmanbacteria bacterium]
MKFGIVVFPGSNCDRDCYRVVKNVLQEEVSFIWHKDRDISGFDCIILPGGFSYGDYLRTGSIARFSPVMEELIEFASKGGYVIGICNGFQILLESGLLPGAMIKNKSLKFICRHVNLRVENNETPYTTAYRKNEVLTIPIAHSDGNYYADDITIKKLNDSGRVVFRYCSPTGEISEEFNPNGSKENIAGICSENGRVLGMMPHPERVSEAILGYTDGVRIFHSLINRVM